MGRAYQSYIPLWMRHVYKQDLSRFIQFAVRVWGADQRFDGGESTALEGIDRLENFFGSLGMPVRLKEIGIGEKHFDEIIEKCFLGRGETIGNCFKPTKNDVREVLKPAH
jgi:hypothetical protein